MTGKNIVSIMPKLTVLSCASVLSIMTEQLILGITFWKNVRACGGIGMSCVMKRTAGAGRCLIIEQITDQSGILGFCKIYFQSVRKMGDLLLPQINILVWTVEGRNSYGIHVASGLARIYVIVP